jgi:uncharacterized delta-60 repeat protein
VKTPATRFLMCLTIICAVVFGAPKASAQIQVNGANPNNSAQGTTNLNVIVSGSGFKKGAKAQWFVTGTTNPGGVTVNSTAFNNSGQLTTNITVAADAVIANFDIQVTNTDGRTGKGTELFAIKTKAASACIVPTPLNIVPAATACANPGGSTCLDSTFGNATTLPPGGLTLTNTDGSIPSVNDLDTAQAVFPQQMPDGTARILAIGTTSNPNVSGQLGIAVVRYNTDGTLDTLFGTGGIATFYPTTIGGSSVRDGALDPNGNALAIMDAAGTTILARFTSQGMPDFTFHSSGYVTLSTLKPFAMVLQADGKIVVAGTRIVGKALVGSLVRFNPDGSLDTSFGSAGQVNLNSLSLLYSVALQTVNSQQYILAAGGAASTAAFSLARLTPSGTLDTSFGSSAGYSTTDFCGTGSTVFSVNVDTAGNILAGGTAALVASGPPKFGVARFDHNGLLDTSFGDPSSSGLTRTGRTILDFYGYKNFLMSLLPVLDANGNQVSYLAAGYAGQSTGQFSQNQYLVLARYHLDGSLDTTFGTNGSGGLAIDFGSANNSVMKPAGHNTIIQSDGRITTVGTSAFVSGPNAGYNFALARVWQ